jgi:hypothetical protein
VIRFLTRRRVQIASAVVASGFAIAALRDYGRRPTAPELPQPAATPPTAPEPVPLIEPKGDQPYLPAQLKWRSVPGAVRYRVTISEVDDEEVWTAVTPASVVVIPEKVRSRFLAYKTLCWRVVAQTRKGEKLAESETARFRLGPAE